MAIRVDCRSHICRVADTIGERIPLESFSSIVESPDAKNSHVARYMADVAIW